MFTENLTAFFDTAEHGTLATINSSEVNGIFDREFVAMTVGSVDVEGFKPVFTCATSDVFDVDVGDVAVIKSTTYAVVLNMPDGTGVSRLILRK